MSGFIAIFGSSGSPLLARCSPIIPDLGVTW